MKMIGAFVAAALLATWATPAAASGIPINMKHLNDLNEDVTVGGTDMLLTHVYSEYPDYKWVDASGEGVACVDDVARAAVVYLNQYEQTRDIRSLKSAKKALNFVMHMQAEDGEFYNFVNRDLSINTTGSTSKKSFSWWAARGMWSLGLGARVLSDTDPEYASKLQQHFLLANQALQRTVNSKYGQYQDLHGKKVPAWVEGTDAMSNALLGLAEFYQIQPREEVRDSMQKLGRALSEFQYGDYDQYPYGAHLDWTGSATLWHAWGSGQTFALAKAGRVLGNQNWIQSAKQEADQLFSHLLVTGMIKEMAPTPNKNEQIAYGVNMLTQGFLEVYTATQDPIYAKSAGLAASWFTGNNDANFNMYEPSTGMGYDGLNGDTRKVNVNSGAESTIEALMALQAVNRVELSTNYLYAKTFNRQVPVTYEAEGFEAVVGHPTLMQPKDAWTGDALYSGGLMSLQNGDAIQKTIFVNQEGDYLLYSALVKPNQSAAKAKVKVLVDGVVVGTVQDLRSSDQEYLTQVKLTDRIQLAAGPHTVRIQLEADAQGKPVGFDTIVLQPTIESAYFYNGTNRLLKLERNLVEKKNTFRELF
ncbi:hypothetical protein [Tumebacillus permanentifrigoris]|uniref:Uncharacterized protein n=1 Tax=Tumebacillus permanentifrigoris TaxID=378543 RepID=A0A316D8G3_9BACL|nr:hypothetical protein [Tumebacillus permanentifrigoris]PWK06658.1 hypothetical protein C7459_11982 [Tumebacillus permanentifrigoris]